MNESQMMHALPWNGENVAGWIATEKLDGCRAYWDGSGLWTRGGKAIAIPQSWRDALPGTPLDCELFGGYDTQRAVVAAARYGRIDDTMRLMVFDAPCHMGDYMTRMACVCSNDVVVPVTTTLINSTDHALAMMRRVQARGGEGLMVRHPWLTYKSGRTNLMLKMKEEL